MIYQNQMKQIISNKNNSIFRYNKT